MEKHDIVILGAGLTGLSAGYHLGEGYVIFEAKPWTGGMAGSYLPGLVYQHQGWNGFLVFQFIMLMIGFATALLYKQKHQEV